MLHYPLNKTEIVAHEISTFKDFKVFECLNIHTMMGFLDDNFKVEKEHNKGCMYQPPWLTQIYSKNKNYVCNSSLIKNKSLNKCYSHK